MYIHSTLRRVDAIVQVIASGNGGNGASRGVRPVYLRCSRGTVSWRYPGGALRVVLSSESGNGFRGCIKVSGPARVYLETGGALRQLYAPGDGKHEALHRCFHSRGRVAGLFVEADSDGKFIAVGKGVSKSRVELKYDLEASNRLEIEEEEVECRPCTKEELAKAYCQSDLVARGTVSAVEARPELEIAELVIGLTKTLRRVEETEDNEIESGDIDFRKEVRVRVPASCDARHGQGEFVIMAKRRLGDLTLACAPRLEAWAEAVRELGTAPCVLRS
ncbi:meteorin-like protein isoform X2 [Orussus abietinus]|uniref:meteorin-like protein isoform X2 n=1 Tax=Orussus abietinus TaxID=222816 RepID=UPI000626CC25|nr:meteorin-like protein isoform X2 [Orussus abietinus]